jgi:hypothetical protein
VGLPDEDVGGGQPQGLTRLLLDRGRRAVARAKGVDHDQHEARAAGLQGEGTRVELVVDPGG